MISRYAIVAMLCLILHNAIMIAGDALGASYVLSVITSFVVVVVVGYGAHAVYSFTVSPSINGFWRYALAMIGNVPLSLATLWLLVDVAGLPMVMAAPMSTVMLIGFNFVASRWAVAGKKQGLWT